MWGGVRLLPTTTTARPEWISPREHSTFPVESTLGAEAVRPTDAGELESLLPRTDDTCPHQRRRFSTYVPIICGACGVTLGKAPGSRCSSCRGDYRRADGWKRGEIEYAALVEPHIASAHLEAAERTVDLERSAAAASAAADRARARQAETRKQLEAERESVGAAKLELVGLRAGAKRLRAEISELELAKERAATELDRVRTELEATRAAATTAATPPNSSSDVDVTVRAATTPHTPPPPPPPPQADPRWACRVPGCARDFSRSDARGRHERSSAHAADDVVGSR